MKIFGTLMIVGVALAATSAAEAANRICRTPPGTNSDPGPDSFWAESPQACPNINAPVYALTIGDSIEGDTMLDCFPLGTSAISCGAYPQEYVPGGGYGSNLQYDWSVRINSVDYTYPPTNNPFADFSCHQGDHVFVLMRVWNGGASSSRSAGFTCGNEVN